MMTQTSENKKAERDLERAAKLHAKIRAVILAGFPNPGLPPKEEFRIDRDAIERIKKREAVKVGWRNKGDRKGVQGEWFGMCNSIAISYWGTPVGRKTPLAEHTKAVDHVVLKAVLKMTSGDPTLIKHAYLTKEMLAMGLHILQQWDKWLDKAGMRATGHDEDEFFDAGLPPDRVQIPLPQLVAEHSEKSINETGLVGEDDAKYAATKYDDYDDDEKDYL